MKLLEGKTALITGASRGIGKGIAATFAKHGAQVAFTYLSSKEKAKLVEEELGNNGSMVRGYQSNAAILSEAESLIDSVVEEFGTIDILVNNAGITRDGLLMRMSEDDWNDVIEINLKSVFNTTKAIQRTFLKQRSGSIINLTSVIGVKGNAGQSNYAASKAGIIGFTKSIALELGSRSIRCNAIAPGFIETEMTSELDQDMIDKYAAAIPLKRSGTVDDVANLALFLGSDLSKYITGQVLHVDGGMVT